MSEDTQNRVGRWLNESPYSPVLPGQIDTFDDAAAPDNDLLVDEVDYRNTYYQETLTVLSNTGAPQREGSDPQILNGTILGDAFETVNGAGANPIGAAQDAWGVARDVLDVYGSVRDFRAGQTLAFFDPFNFLGGQLMGWMLEHVEPLRKSLDSVSGNPDMVQAYSQSWAKISERLAEIAETWGGAIAPGTAGWAGAAGDAYRDHAQALVARVTALAGLADVLAQVNEAMSGLVEAVRSAITDVLADLAGVLAEITAILIVSGGTATPALIARALLGISTAGLTISQLLLRLAAEIVDLQSLTGHARDGLEAVLDVRKAAAGA